MTDTELNDLINEETQSLALKTDPDKIFNYLEKKEPEKKDIFEDEPITEEQQTEPITEELEQGEDNIEYGLGLSFTVMHENGLPPIVRFLIESFTQKTVNVKAMAINAKQRKDLTKAYEIIAQHLTSGDHPLLAATISVLSITAGQVLLAIEDKPKQGEVKIEKSGKVETRGRKKKTS